MVLGVKEQKSKGNDDFSFQHFREKGVEGKENIMKIAKKMKKAISVMAITAMAGTTALTGMPAAVYADSAADTSLITDRECTGNASYISTYMKSDYYNAAWTGFQITFKYTDTSKALATDNSLGFNDTFEFLSFDTSWGGWNRTTVGPDGYDLTENATASDVEENKEYTVTVPIATIEDKLDTGNAVNGINLQTGGIGDNKVKIVSMNYVQGTIESQPTVLEGAWHKTGESSEEHGELTLTSGQATAYGNPWFIEVLGFNVSTFTEPTVAVTVEYDGVGETPIYPQAEILDYDTGAPLQANYPQVSENGERVFLQTIPSDTTKMKLAFDVGVVKKVEIYDAAEEYTTSKTGLGNADITSAMAAGWNLGNALDATSNGEVSETLWGNPEVAKRTFKQIAEAGFKTVRIPTTWVDCVTVTDSSASVNNTELATRLNRLKTVVDMAMDYDLFVIINVQHDGADSVTGSWLDVDATNQTYIRQAFGTLWTRIANKFKSYDQHVIFESMNEVMEQGNYGTPSATTWANINALNQLFVDTVRGTGSKNDVRFLLMPGYNTNIDQTVTDSFVLPSYNGSTANEMVSVHFYDPYEFTVSEDSGKTTVTEAELANIATQFQKLKTKFVDNGIPVVVGEFAAMDKGTEGNRAAVISYITKVVEEAQAKGLAYIYWDNGYTGDNGMGLWNRYTNGRSSLGKDIISILVEE